MPNSRQASPDLAEDDRETARPANNGALNNMENDAGVGQPMLGGLRRDENSISFRHFLQPHSDVVPSPAPTCRNRTRGTQSGAVDLVDMAMALPDFVQDHLVVESLAIAEQHQNDGAASGSGSSSLDMNVLNEILPDFATSQLSHSLPPQGVHSRRRNIPEEPTAPPEVPHPGSGSSSTLPDFLSDGPMQCTDSNADNAVASSSRSASHLIASSSVAERSRIADDSSRSTSFDSSEPLRSEVDRLRREVSDRNRRISQLENEILRLRTNIGSLETALRTAEQTAIESEARRLAVETRLASSIAQPSSSSGGSGDASLLPVNGLQERADIQAHELQEIAQSSESLVSQLLQNMIRLKGLAISSHRTEEHKNKSSKDDNSSK